MEIDWIFLVSYLTKGTSINSWSIRACTSISPWCHTCDLPIVSILSHCRASRVTLWNIRSPCSFEDVGSHSNHLLTWQVSIPPDRRPMQIIWLVTSPLYADRLLHVLLDITATFAWNYCPLKINSEALYQDVPSVNFLVGLHLMRLFPSQKLQPGIHYCIIFHSK